MMLEHKRFLVSKSWTIDPKWSLEDQARLPGITSVWEYRLHRYALLREHIPKTAPTKEAADHVTGTLLLTNNQPKGGQLFIRSPLTSQQPLHDMCGLA